MNPEQYGMLVEQAAIVGDTTVKDIDSGSKLYAHVRARWSVFLACQRLGENSHRIATWAGYNHASLRYALQQSNAFPWKAPFTDALLEWAAANGITPICVPPSRFRTQREYASRQFPVLCNTCGYYFRDLDQLERHQQQ